MKQKGEITKGNRKETKIEKVKKRWEQQGIEKKKRKKDREEEREKVAARN